MFVRRHFGVILFVMFLILLVTGCQSKTPSQSGKPTVVVTLFPLYDFSKNIVGSYADVSLLLPPGVEVHSFEPRPADMVEMQNADIFVYTGDAMEPWVRRLFSSMDSKGTMVIDASRGIVLARTVADEGGDDAHHHEGEVEGAQEHHHHGNLDPHIWLDFANAQKMVDTIARALSEKDPVHKEEYVRNAESYKARLVSLDRKYRETLATCEKKHIIHGGHFAFNYLAARYGLEYESAYPGSADTEPSARRVIELRNKLKKHGLDTVYYEELINPRIAEVLAKETGSKLLRLHGAGNVSKEEMEQGVTFIQLMEQNLANLRSGLKCK